MPRTHWNRIDRRKLQMRDCLESHEGISLADVWYLSSAFVMIVSQCFCTFVATEVSGKDVLQTGNTAASPSGRRQKTSQNEAGASLNSC